jgi:hypothetical protein
VRAAGRPVVLVTLQYGLSDSEQLEPLLALLKVASERFAFWIRLHPAMPERRRGEVRARLTGAGIFELDLCSDLPLPALLGCCDLHLTHSSSTVIDASQFGVVSVLTTEYGAELFQPFVRDGWAHVETGDAQHLAATLSGLLSARRRSTAAVSSSQAALEALIAESSSLQRQGAAA